MTTRRMLLTGGGMGYGMTAVIASLLATAGDEVVIVDDETNVRKRIEKDFPKINVPEPKAEPYYTGSRSRAQWKNETNYRGRNR